MKKSITASISTLLLLSPLAYAGVVMDLVTMNASGHETERSRIYAQSGKVRMEQVDGDETAATMIFLGNEFLYIDHREKSYIVKTSSGRGIPTPTENGKCLLNLWVDTDNDKAPE